MRVSNVWVDKVIDKNGQRQPVNYVQFHPNGQHVVTCCGSNILIYDSTSGDLKHTLKSHKDLVYCVDFSDNGSLMASCGADKSVIIWNTLKWDGVLRYSHSECVTCVRFNPVTSQVASCASADFGYWSTEQKSVNKYRAPNRIVCCSWSNDGQLLALGLFTGQVSIRNRAGDEVSRVDRGDSPVWSLQWSPPCSNKSSLLDDGGPGGGVDTLTITDWNQRLSFYKRDGKQQMVQVGSDIDLGFDPCTISYVCGGNFMAIGGSDKKVTLFTRDGIPLGQVAEREGWVWSCRGKPSSNTVAVASNDGSVSLHQITFNTVHALYQDRYAFRENMTDMTIQHLSNDQRHTISCGDMVKKIAIYKDRLAVQLSDRIVIYESATDDPEQINYRVLETVNKKFECNLLVITSQNFILCLEKRLQMYSFTGDLEREWSLDAWIRYIKVIGGAPGREGLLVGLKNGQVLTVFLGNPFPIQLVKIDATVRCLDLNRSRTKVAVVDEHTNCLVFDVKTKELLYQETGASSVSWNIDHDDMICFSGTGTLYIKAGNFPCHKQKMAGFVVGFKGSKIFCLQSTAMNTIEVPQSTALEQFLDAKDYKRAYEIACLGVTDGAWRRLAMESLETLNFDVAKKAFVKLQDFKFLKLIDYFEKMKMSGQYNVELCLAEIHAYQGKFHEAAKFFRRAGHPKKAIEMYTDLNMWEYATKAADETEQVTINEILIKKAQVQEDKNDLISAAKTYIEVGDYMKAVNIYGRNKWFDKLAELAKSMNKLEIKALNRCAEFFRQNNCLDEAIEVYRKLSDIKSLVAMYVELQRWEDAFKLADLYPALKEQIYLPYANWLALQDRFVEAQENFRKAGHMNEALSVMLKLVKNAVNENRFGDASYYYWLLSTEYLNMIPKDKTFEELSDVEKDHVNKFLHFQDLCELYHVYYPIFLFVEEPFSAYQPEAILHMARYLLHRSMLAGSKKNLPHGISMNYVLYALVRLSKSLKCFKFGRYVTEDLLNHYRIAPSWRDTVEVNSLYFRGQPHTDNDELCPVCWQCGSVNPLLNLGVSKSTSINCNQCQEAFVFSSYNYENLGLVEFKPVPSVSDAEAIKCIQTGCKSTSRKNSTAYGSDTDINNNNNNNGESENTNIMVVNDPSTDIQERTAKKVTQLTRDELIQLSPNETFIVNWDRPSIPVRYYRLAATGLGITMCPTCFRFFHSDDYEFLVLQHHGCAFCRTPVTSSSAGGVVQR